MNYCTNALKVIFTVLFSCIISQIYGQQTSAIVHFADGQYKVGNYSGALLEYQRAIFFGEATTGELFHQMGRCSFELKKYDQAIEYFDRAYFAYTNDSLRINSLLDKAKCNIVTRSYNIALIDLFGLTDSLPEKTYRLKQFYIGLCYFGTEQFDEAKKYFVDAVNPSFEKQRQSIDQLLSNKRKLNRPNPRTASTMSMCFPGLGQFYAGDYKNGLNSLILTSALITLGIKISIEQTLSDGIFTILPWFQRYYQGGYMRAEKIAMEKRAHNRNEVYEKVLQEIVSTKQN